MDRRIPIPAAVAGVSRAAFAERFRRRVGVSPGGYLLRIRMARASTLLRDERSTLKAVAAAVGYGSEAAFSTAFKRYAGTTPGAFRGRSGSTADQLTDGEGRAPRRRQAQLPSPDR